MSSPLNSLGHSPRLGRFKLRLVTEEAIVSGDCHIATRDGEAMFFVDDLDLAAFAGTDSGDTPYYLIFEDSAGKHAAAYAGAAGGGEALGAELFTDGDCSSDSFSKVDWVYDAVGEEYDATNLSAKSVYQSSVATVGSLYKHSFEIKNYSAGTIRPRVFGYLADAPLFSGDGVITVTGTAILTSIVGAQAVNGFTGSVDNFTCKKYTDIPATGLHLMSTKNGTTRNMASVDDGFNPNAITSIAIYGSPLVLEEEISLGDAHIATKDGEAMFFHDSLDFSTYAGTDLGFTPYYLEFIDDAGLIAAAYAGAAGGGEALGADALNGWDFTSGWLVLGDITITDADTFVVNSGNGGVRKSGIISENRLYQYVVVGTTTSLYISGLYAYNFSTKYRDNIFGGGGTTSYFSAIDTGIYLRGISAGTTDITSQTLKLLTDIPATGLHLLSSKNGTTRNMASVETGFDPNKISEIRVWRV